MILAAMARIWNYGGWSYSHDELAGLIRLNYPSFSDFFREGVMNTDTHPAFTQVFLWFWAGAFGHSEWLVRLPFVLAGIGSVYLTYKIAYHWFERTTAELSGLTMALLGFPILYSQIARPYAFGLFFCLLMVWRWQIFLFGKEEKKTRSLIYFALALLACMLTHYFAFFFAMIVALTGLFFLRKDTWKPYLVSGSLAALLFAPHIPVSLKQISMGGVGSWLPPPDKDFLWQHIVYSMNESTVTTIAIIGLALTGLTLNLFGFRYRPSQMICLIWFLAPFLAGYFYSVQVNPVIQHSTLLFSFPFLLIFLFSFFEKPEGRTRFVLQLAWTIFLAVSLLFDQRFYQKEFFGPFREITEKVNQVHEEHKENVTILMNTSSQEIFDCYFDLLKARPDYHFMAGDRPGMVQRVRDLVETSNTSHFLYAWSNFRSDPEIQELIKRKYPCIMLDDQHFNARLTLFAKNDTCRRDTLFYSQTGFESDVPSMAYDRQQTDTTQAFEGSHSLKVGPGNEYCLTLKTTVRRLFGNRSYEPLEPVCVNIIAQIYSKDSFNLQAVMDIGQPEGKRDWQARPLKQFSTEKNKWQTVIATLEIPRTAYPDDEVVIFLWNNGKNSFWMDQVEISSFSDSRFDPFETRYRD